MSGAVCCVYLSSIVAFLFGPDISGEPDADDLQHRFRIPVSAPELGSRPVREFGDLGLMCLMNGDGGKRIGWMNRKRTSE